MTPAPFIVFCVIEAKGNWVLTSSVRTVVAVLGLVAALSASAADYKILEIRPGHAGIFAGISSTLAGELLHWLDDRRLLIAAYDTEIKPLRDKESRTSVAAFTLQVLDTESGEYRRYTTSPVSGVCVRDGVIRYVEEGPDGERRVKEGPIGQEVVVEWAVIPRDVRGNAIPLRRDFFSCRYYTADEMPRGHGGRVEPLRTEHGFYEISKFLLRGGFAPHWLITRDGRVIEVDLPHGEQISYPTAYSTVLGAYLLRRLDSNIGRGVTNKFYLLFPDAGLVNSLEIPSDQRWGFLGSARVVRGGIIADSGAINPRAQWDPGDAGLYYFSGVAFERFLHRPTRGSRTDIRPNQNEWRADRLVRGSIRQIAVSPDGCRIAAQVDSWDRPDPKERNYVAVIDFCLKGEARKK